MQMDESVQMGTSPIAAAAWLDREIKDLRSQKERVKCALFKERREALRQGGRVGHRLKACRRLLTKATPTAPAARRPDGKPVFRCCTKRLAPADIHPTTKIWPIVFVQIRGMYFSPTDFNISHCSIDRFSAAVQNVPLQLIFIQHY